MSENFDELFEKAKNSKIDLETVNDPFTNAEEILEKEYEDIDSIPEDSRKKLIDEWLESKRLLNKHKKAQLKMRKKYANKAYWLATGSIVLMFTILIASGVHHGDAYFLLSDMVLISMMSAVTVNVLAILIIVIKNLFPTSNHELPEEKTTKTSFLNRN